MAGETMTPGYMHLSRVHCAPIAIRTYASALSISDTNIRVQRTGQHTMCYNLLVSPSRHYDRLGLSLCAAVRSPKPTHTHIRNDFWKPVYGPFVLASNHVWMAHTQHYTENKYYFVICSVLSLPFSFFLSSDTALVYVCFSLPYFFSHFVSLPHSFCSILFKPIDVWQAHKQRHVALWRVCV